MTMMSTDRTETEDGFRDTGETHGVVPAGIGTASIWAALTTDTQCCVVLAEINGEVRFGNSGSGGCGCAFEACPLKGTDNVAEKLPTEQAAQLLTSMERASRNGTPVVLVWFLGGVRSRTVIRPIETESGSLILLTTRSAKDAYFTTEEADREGEIVHSLVGDAGPLASLTPRETQVLEMIGRGFSTAKIAKTLDRSTKTIEWHRASIGNKLNASNRVELARIAISAGLTTL